MKICIVGIKNLDEPGGIETHVRNVTKQLIEMGHEVHLIVNSDNESTIPGVNIHEVPYMKGRFTRKITMLLFSILKIKRINPDVIYANDAVHGFGTTLLLRRIAPIVYVAHGVGYLREDWPKWVRFFLKVMEKYAFRNADEVIAVDKRSGNEVKKVRGKEVPVIPNGVVLDEYEKELEEPKVFENEINVVFVGRLIPTKGVFDAIKTFKKVNEKNIGLYMIGKGPKRNELEEMSKDENNIHILGFIEDIKPFLQNADIFIMPSYYEGMPIVALEAMASKTPCLCYEVGDLPERFEHKEEIYFTNKENFARDLKELANDKELRDKIVENAFQKLKEKYTWSKITKEIEKVFKSVKEK